jgi:hypothetical protein
LGEDILRNPSSLSEILWVLEDLIGASREPSIIESLIGAPTIPSQNNPYSSKDDKRQPLVYSAQRILSSQIIHGRSGVDIREADLATHIRPIQPQALQFPTF